jgi:hypothetical protein
LADLDPRIVPELPDSLKRLVAPDLDPEIRLALENLSSSRQRILALLKIGFSFEEIATALGVKHQSVRGWADGGPMTPRNEDSLDEFRSIVSVLYHALGKDAARAFFRSRPAHGEMRPLECVHTDPHRVGGAAMAEIRRYRQLGAQELQEYLRQRSDGKEAVLEGDAAEHIEGARGREVAPITVAGEPETPESVKAMAGMTNEKRSWKADHVGGPRDKVA